MNLSTSLSGMKAAQVALDVTSHNIANVNTPNFKREVIELKSVAYNSNSSQITTGSGVAIAKIYNATNPILDKQYPKAISDKSEYSNLSNSVNSLQKILDNPALNLSQSMQDIYNSFQDLANNPTDLSVRQTALNSAQIFIDKSVALMNELSSTKYSLTDNYKNGADSINSLIRNISNINENINRTGNNPNSNLTAQRDTLILNLSELSGINVSNNGKTIVTTSGKLLLSDSFMQELTIKDIPNIIGGSIGGDNKFLSNVLDPAISNLAKVVNQFAEEINKQSEQGYDLNGNIGQEIFNLSSITNPSISLNITDPKNLAASTTVNSVGNGNNAQNISDIRSIKFDKQNLQEKYASLVSNIDNNAQQYSQMKDSYSYISDSINSEIQEVSGVNLDEEAVNLMKYQRLYQANAQALKIQDELFGTLINTIS